jgi:hypothetical protein
MIIRKYGKIKPGKVKCSECDALLKYDVDDIKQYMWGDYRVKCPICKGWITVYRENGE